MDESLAVLERLALIEALDRDGAPPARVLAELRLLVAEAEAWSKTEGGDPGERAVSRLQAALAAEMIAV